MEKNIQYFLTILCTSVIIYVIYATNTHYPSLILKRVENQWNIFKSLPSWTHSELSGIDIKEPSCKNVLVNNQEDIEISLQAPNYTEWKLLSESVIVGGESLPANCSDPDHVAIIVPYRDRATQLPVFLRNIHPFLARQHIHYRVYIINQADTHQFNRAALFNVGFKESLKDFNWTCFIFHDVDHLPEDPRNLYSCPDQPRHMAVAVDKWNYKLLYTQYFGGIVALRREHFLLINGVSNMFWGWGGEDDDMRKRITGAGLSIVRYPPDIARYTTIKHGPVKPNPDRFKLLRQGQARLDDDGLSSVVYTRIPTENYQLYTNITVYLHRTE